MTDFAESLHRDAQYIKTSAELIGSEWVSKVQKAQREIAMRSYEKIIDIVGAENFKLCLPLWETSGSIFRDLIRRDITFTGSGVTLAQTGLLHQIPSFTVNDYIMQDAVATVFNNETITTYQQMNAAGSVVVQKLKTGACKPSFVYLKVDKTGSPGGTLELQIRTAKDGAAISNGTSATVNCSAIATGWAGFYFPAPPELEKDTTYYLALRYVTPPADPASTYIGWGYDAAGGYGMGRHYYDGGSWTDTAGQDHTFRIFGDELLLDNDFSVIVVSKDSDASNLTGRGLFNIGSTDAISASASFAASGRYQFSANDGTQRNIYAYSLYGQFIVTALTFSKTAESNKANLYINGRLYGSASGTAGAAANRQTKPMLIGVSCNNTNGALANYWEGLIGPVIVTKSELTPAQIGTITNQLLALRRLQVAI